MSKTIDEKVVEMRFDNRNFEKNVQVSLNTLDKLKQKTDMSKHTKSFDALGKAANRVSFDKMGQSIDTVKVKLSAMQVVGATVISKLTNEVMSFARKVENIVKDSLIGGGIRRAQNIENAHFMLQGLLKDEEKVQAVMADAMDSVDGTAYAYDEAAKAASQFAASGLEAGEDMQQALRGITGVAAMTNSSYEDISRVFTTVAGNGRLMGDQLLQLSSRGMNAAATLAEYFGKSEQEIREMVSKGQISFKMFSEAMDDAFGEHAKKANDTFNGAMSNVKAALSRIGAKFVSPLIVQNGKLVESLNLIRMRINDINKKIDPIANAFVKTVERIVSLIDRVTNNSLAFNFILVGIMHIIKNVGKVAKAAGQAFMEMFPFKSQRETIKMAENFAKVTKAMIFTDEKVDKLKRTFKGVIAIFDTFNYVVGSIIKFGLKELSELLGINNGTFLDTTANIGDMLVAFRDWVKEGDRVTVALTKITDGIKKVVTWISNLRKSAKGASGGGGSTGQMTSTLTRIGKVFKHIFSGIKEYVTGGIEVIKKFIETHKELDENFTLGDMLRDFKDQVLSYFFDIEGAIDKLIGAFSKLRDAGKNSIGNIEHPFKKMFDTFKTKITELKNKYLPNLDFGSVFAVAFSTGVIVFIRKFSKAVLSLQKFLGQIASPLKGVNKVLNAFAGTLQAYTKKLKAESILIIATAIGVLALSLKILADVPWTSLAKGIGALAALGIILVGLSAALGVVNVAISFSTLGKLGFVLATFAGVLIILAKAIDAINQVEDLSGGVAKITQTGLLLAAFIEGIGLLSKYTLKGANLGQIGIAMIGFAAGIKILISVLKDLSELSDVKFSKNQALVIVSAMAGFAMIIAASQNINWKAAVGVTAMAVGVKLIVSALTEIQNVDLTDKTRELVILGGILTAMVVIGNMAGKSMQQAGIGILAMAGGLLIIAKTVSTLKKYNPKELAKAVLSFAGIFLAMVPVIAASKLAGKEAHKAGLMMLEISGAMILLVGAVALLGNMKREKVIQGVAAISSLELVFGALIALSKFGTATAESYKTIVALTVSVAAITGCIAVLTLLDQDRLNNATIALSGIMVVFGMFEALNVFLSKEMTNLNRTTITLGMMIGVVGALAGVLWIIAQLDGDNVLKSATALSEMLLALAGSVAIIQLVKPNIEVAAEGAAAMVAAFAIIVGGIELVLHTLGWIAEMFETIIGEDSMTYIDKGIQVVGKIGEAIGTFFGEAASAFTNSIADDLPSVGTKLSQFMSNAEGFFDGLNKIDPNCAAAARDLTIALGFLTAEDFVNKLLNFVTLGGFDKLFGQSGEMDTSGFKALGEALMSFAEATAGIDESTAEKVKASAEAAKSLVEIAKMIPREGGDIEKLTGNNNMALFGDYMESFGFALKAYANTVDGLNTDSIFASIQPAKDIISVAETIPNDGGAIGYIVGNNNLADFGEQMKVFGQALVSYSLSVQNLQNDGINRSKLAAEQIIEIASMIPANSGVFQAFNGEGKIEEFGNQLSSFAKSLVKYSTEIKGFDADSASGSVEAIKRVLSIGNAVPDKKDFKGMKKFGKQVVNFADYLNDFDKKVKKINTEKLLEAANVINQLSGIFGTMSEIDTKAVKSFDKALTNISIKNLTKFIKDFSKSSKKFTKCGEEILINIAKGMEAKKDVIKKGLSEPLQSALSAMKTYYGQFNSTGSYLVDGLINGISGKIQSAYAAGHKLGEKVLAGTNDAVQVQSPSKKAYETGEYYVEGLVNAIDDNKKTAEEKSNELGNLVNIGLSDALGKGNKAATKLVGELSNIINKAFKGTPIATKAYGHNQYINDLVKSISYGSGALQQFIDRYVKNASNHIVGAGATKKMAAAISAYGKELYNKSSYAAQDASNLADHQKTLSKLESEKKKLEKDIKKNSKKNDKDSKKRVESFKKNLKTVKEQVKSAKNQIIQDQNDIASHTATVYNELRTKLSDSVKAFIDPLAQSIDSGIDLFSKYEDNHTLLEEDKKNLKTYQAEYDELIKKRDEIQNEILKMEKINTTASRQNGKLLEKELEKITKSIDKVKDKIESTEESMEEHTSLTTTSILENMKSQVENVARYQNNLNKLSSEGKVSSGLVEQLKEMGIQGADYVDQFTKMTDEEIKEANRLYDESKKLSASTLTNNFQAAMNKATAWGEAMLTLQEKGFNKTLLENLGDLGIDGSQYIDAFMTMTPEQITDFNNKYAKYLSVPDNVADTVMMSFAKAGNESIAKYIEALNAINNPGSASNDALKLIGTLTGQSIMDIMGSKADISGQFMVQKLSDTINSDKSQKKAKKAGSNTAKNVVKGTDKGFKDSKNDLKNTVNKNYSGVMETEIKKAWDKVKKTTGDGAKSVLTQIRDTWGIKSPSREAIKIVGYFAKGMGIGFDKLDKDVSETATSAAKNVLTAVSNVLDADMDTTPTITPVIDLSEIQNGTNNLNSMFNGISGTVSINNDLANSIRTIQNDNNALWGAVNDLKDTIKQMNNESGDTIFNNDFKIENPDPKAVANEVSNILQRQVDRRSREWA